MYDYYRGVFKLGLMMVISFGLYYYLRDVSFALVSKDMVNSFVLNIKKEGVVFSQDTYHVFVNLINHSIRIAIVSILVYTIVHWSFKFFNFNAFFYSVFAYVIQQSYLIYEYRTAYKATEKAMDLAIENCTYLSIGAALACIIYSCTVRIPNHVN